MIVKTDKDIIYSYFLDNSNMPLGNADAVYFPESIEDVSTLFATAYRDNISVTISGAGTGILGGRIPDGGFVLATDNLKKILEINKEKEYVVVESGVTLDELRCALWDINYCYPPNPTELNASIGGTIACNASGSRSYKYGSTKNFVLELQIVLPTGKILNLKRGEHKANSQGYFEIKIDDEIIKFKNPSLKIPNTTKNAPSFFMKPDADLIDLFIGSEGILGFVYSAKLKIVKKLEKMFSAFVFFDDKDQAFDFVLKVKRITQENRKNEDEGDINPTSLEYMDVNALAILRDLFPNVPENAVACVNFEQEYDFKDEDVLLLAWTQLIESFSIKPKDTWFSDNERDLLYFEEVRHALPARINEIVVKNGVPKIGTDIAVSDKYLPDMLDYYEEVLNDTPFKYAIFGHIGDNHLHINILLENSLEIPRAKEIYKKFILKALEFNGTIFGEHGVGKSKKEYLKMMIKDSGIEEIKNIKKAFDPKNILNKGDVI